MKVADHAATPRFITAGFVVGFSVFNLSPYLGLRFNSCQTMFTGLSPVAPGNHLFMPRLRWFRAGDYVTDLSLKYRLAPPGTAMNYSSLHESLAKLCQTEPTITVAFREAATGARRSENACETQTRSRLRTFPYPPIVRLERARR